jgi:DNA-binding NarL/FixJ family response regulator
MTGTILIADDHPLFRQALAMAASAVCPAARIVESANLMTALNEAAAADDLILILLDLKMPGAEGYSGVALLHAEKPGVPILAMLFVLARSASSVKMPDCPPSRRRLQTRLRARKLTCRRTT